MRLINADELKEMINREIYSSKCPIEINHAITLINNAPTVELTASFMRQQAEDELIRIRAEADQRGYNRGYQFGFYTGQHTKLPTGKWIFAGFCFSTTQYKCSRCKLNSLEKTDFCPNCGAKMKGAEE